MEVAAQLLVLGIDPLDFLYTKDSFKRSLMQELANRAVKEKQLEQRNLAIVIAVEVGKLFKK